MYLGIWISVYSFLLVSLCVVGGYVYIYMEERVCVCVRVSMYVRGLGEDEKWTNDLFKNLHKC